ncbi:MAG: hypothetical protein QM647_00085 [Asticcacaulis sp.]|uniref:hypothetical protein n=1 Tax=Asticcacaulis sp. TaxID=1872648 RepID=UPI0039E6F534
MHDRLTRIDEITEALAGSSAVLAGRVTTAEIAVDSAVIDLLFEKLSAINISRSACADTSFESREYNELLMMGAEVRAAIQGFEDKYKLSLMA